MWRCRTQITELTKTTVAVLIGGHKPFFGTTANHQSVCCQVHHGNVADRRRCAATMGRGPRHILAARGDRQKTKARSPLPRTTSPTRADSFRRERTGPRADPSIIVAHGRQESSGAVFSKLSMMARCSVMRTCASFDDRFTIAKVLNRPPEGPVVAPLSPQRWVTIETSDDSPIACGVDAFCQRGVRVLSPNVHAGDAHRIATILLGDGEPPFAAPGTFERAAVAHEDRDRVVRIELVAVLLGDVLAARLNLRL